MRAFWLLVPFVVACAELKTTIPEEDAGADAGPRVEDAGSDAATNDDVNVPPQDDAAVPHLVFVTTASVDGAFGAAGDPWKAADAICANEATANNLTGDFVAWLSYEDANGTAFNAATRIPDAPYMMPGNIVDGGAPVVIAASKAELLTSGPRVQMDRTATGAQAPQDENALVTWVWTGTQGTGAAAGQTCKRWTSNASTESGIAGNARRIPQYSPTDWTTLNGRTCDAKRRFYCFQK